ncbi:MAG: hypothetical protein DI628_05970 [Blastochloris viridis]|uniref:Uncharacterized protein n=1 Tax=Blastochloris viridis TaxID=1079 RepID=A0A6N4RBM0_BLAVI|nr:MAG: hypothetical protein DI628_05970 [Blastochloris viridis]
MSFERMLRHQESDELEHELASEMDAYGGWNVPVINDEPFRAWRPQGAYPSDFDRRPVTQDCGPEWDFRPADERVYVEGA